jgi:hypothetical protein
MNTNTLRRLKLYLSFPVFLEGDSSDEKIVFIFGFVFFDGGEKLLFDLGEANVDPLPVFLLLREDLVVAQAARVLAQALQVQTFGPEFLALFNLK